jgi:hypothetical protein
VTADLTLAVTADAAIGVDASGGFQQDLTISQAGGRLVVEDLVVRDYPIFLRLVGWS